MFVVVLVVVVVPVLVYLVLLQLCVKVLVEWPSRLVAVQVMVEGRLRWYVVVVQDLRRLEGPATCALQRISWSP